MNNENKEIPDEWLNKMILFKIKKTNGILANVKPKYRRNSKIQNFDKGSLRKFLKRIQMRRSLFKELRNNTRRNIKFFLFQSVC